MKFFWILFFSICVSFSVSAASIKITPTRVDLSERDRIATLTVSNPSDKPILIQTELRRWTQEHGDEVYLPTDELIAIPAAFSIPAGQKQQMRIALQRPLANAEMAYRLFLTEVVSAEEKSSSSGLKVALRISVPLFVEPLTPPIEAIDWEVIQKDKMFQIKAINKSNVHVFIEELALSTELENQLSNNIKTFKYLLPYQSYQWQIQIDNKPMKPVYQIRAKVNGKETVYKI